MKYYLAASIRISNLSGRRRLEYFTFLAKKFPDQQLASLVAAKNEGIEMFRLRNHILQFEGQISVGRVRRTSRSSRYVHVSRRQRSGGQLRSSGEVRRHACRRVQIVGYRLIADDDYREVCRTADPAARVTETSRLPRWR